MRRLGGWTNLLKLLVCREAALPGAQNGPTATILKLDTHRFVKRLTDAGMEERHAEAIVEGLSEADTSELATKFDLKTEIADLRTELKTEIADLRTELKSDIGEIRVAMSQMKAELIRFMYVQALTVIGLTVGPTVKLLP